MSGQKEMFDLGGGAARRYDPATAKAAAASISSDRLSRLYRMILDVLREAGDDGLTSREIAEKIGVDWGSVSNRLRPMAKLGLVADTGRTRTNASGREAIVWTIEN